MKEITMAMNPEKTDLSAENFRTLAQKILPHLRTIQEELLQAYGEEGGASIHLEAKKDGYLEVAPYKSSWRLCQYTDDKPTIRFEYKECLTLEE